MSYTLTEKSIRILRKLFERSTGTMVFTVRKTQSEIAKELNITRQALNVHLRKLKKEGLIRTGRGFIDITKEALQVLGLESSEAFVFLKVEPRKREEVYRKIKELPAIRVYRVTGEIDLIAIVPQAHLSQFLEKATTIEGIESTSSHVVISILK
ncbi:MAG: Lrp/AsnC family transcriptional regulator [Candidatus Verstraetearchaeota archaeon]|nr:Lrp/AsnC family transcriptional regulator [Candidatus Verstraetearchaeota archaeon]